MSRHQQNHKYYYLSMSDPFSISPVKTVLHYTTCVHNLHDTELFACSVVICLYINVCLFAFVFIFNSFYVSHNALISLLTAVLSINNTRLHVHLHMNIITSKLRKTNWFIEQMFNLSRTTVLKYYHTYTLFYMYQSNTNKTR